MRPRRLALATYRRLPEMAPDDRWLIPALSSVLDQLETDEAVVKPAVSASAHATWRTSQVQAEGDDERFRTLVAAGDVLVQPLVRAIAESGEWSLVCFGGAASHAVLKR